MTPPSRRKIGLIVECGPQGADLKVLRHVLLRLDSSTEIVPITLDSKRRLEASCGLSATQLLKDGCDCVLIVWDLHPAWRTDGKKPCRKQDRDKILSALAAAGVIARDFESPQAEGQDHRKVFLVCIQEELEAWLLADHTALETVLSKPTRPVRLKRIRDPEALDNPKKRLNKWFQEHIGREYSDLIHAEKIIREIDDLNKIAKACPTFRRFLGFAQPR